MQKAMNDQPIQPGEGILHHAEGVDLIPANIELAGLEVALVNSMNREKMLKQVLDGAKREYDYILLDCTPSLGMLRTNYGKQIDTLIRQAYGSKIKVFDQTIPRSVRAAETSAAGKSIFQYDPKSKVAEAYQSLAKTNY